MPYRKIITGQKVSSELKARGTELRQNMTPAEAKLWQRLRTNRLEGFHFRRQQIIDRYIVDFYCHTVGLVVEADGGIHLGQEEYDQERENYLTSLGLKMLRFTNQDINTNINLVLTQILEECQALTNS